MGSGSSGGTSGLLSAIAYAVSSHLREIILPSICVFAYACYRTQRSSYIGCPTRADTLVRRTHLNAITAKSFLWH